MHAQKLDLHVNEDTEEESHGNCEIYIFQLPHMHKFTILSLEL